MNPKLLESFRDVVRQKLVLWEAIGGFEYELRNELGLSRDIDIDGLDDLIDQVAAGCGSFDDVDAIGPEIEQEILSLAERKEGES